MNELQIIKRNGTRQTFNKNKIYNAVFKAMNEVGEINDDIAHDIANEIQRYAILNMQHDTENTVEDIQDEVENLLMQYDVPDVAKAYIIYRHERAKARANSFDKTIKNIVNGFDEYWTTENSNKDATIASTQRDYLAGTVSTDITRNELLPKDIMEAHDNGLIHFHDIDYFVQHIHNCCLVNLEDMLQNGTVINKTLIEKPHSFATACNIATQIMAVVASGQYGGQSISLTHLAPFVDISRQKIKKQIEEEMSHIFVRGAYYDQKEYDEAVEYRLKQEIARGVQTMQYQINTLNTSNGQTPFVTVFMYLNEAKDEQEKRDLALIIQEVLKQRIRGIKNECGVWITPAFPKLIYVLEEDNIYEDSPYWYLTELAAKCTAKRLVPDYISEKIMKQLKDGNCYPVMGCRSALTVWHDGNGQPKFYGRFNQGVVTINLPDIALTAKKEDRDFWDVFNERMDLCHRALQLRNKRLRGTTSDISPIHWQYGALARLKKGQTIDKLLYNGYSTLSLGFAGLWECVLAWTGEKLLSDNGKQFGLQVMQRLNDYCKTWKLNQHIDYSLYGTPLESTTYKFAKCLKNRFGIIDGVTDKDYITNSYHIHVTEQIDAFSKLAFESEFQALAPGGAISYVEVPNMQNNIPAVLEIMKFIYNHIMYAELNTKSDYCQNCGFSGEIKIVDVGNGKLDWECPQCGNRDHSKLNIARRTCGYIGSNFWNQGRTQEIKDRVLHLE